MKIIPFEQLDEKLANALKEQGQHEAIGVTEGKGAVTWLLVRLPEFFKEVEVDVVTMGEVQQRRIAIQATAASSKFQAANGEHPVFGAGRGTLTIVSDDDDHLKNLPEYIK